MREGERRWERVRGGEERAANQGGDREIGRIEKGTHPLDEPLGLGLLARLDGRVVKALGRRRALDSYKWVEVFAVVLGRLGRAAAAAAAATAPWGMQPPLYPFCEVGHGHTLEREKV